eukprot:6480302-Amphidinium_carterae.1
MTCSRIAISRACTKVIVPRNGTRVFSVKQKDPPLRSVIMLNLGWVALTDLVHAPLSESSLSWCFVHIDSICGPCMLGKQHQSSCPRCAPSQAWQPYKSATCHCLAIYTSSFVASNTYHRVQDAKTTGYKGCYCQGCAK